MGIRIAEAYGPIKWQKRAVIHVEKGAKRQRPQVQ